MQHDRNAGPLPLDAGLWDPNEDGMMDSHYAPYVRGPDLLSHARRHPRAVAGGVLGVFLLLAGVVAAQRLIGHDARPASGLRAWRDRFDDWRDDLGDRFRDLDIAGRLQDLDLPGRVRDIDVPGRARPLVDRASRYAKDHAVEGVTTLAAVAAVLGAVAVALYDQNSRD